MVFMILLEDLEENLVLYMNTDFGIILTVSAQFVLVDVPLKITSTFSCTMYVCMFKFAS